MPGRAKEFSPVPESDRACGFARRLCVEAPMKRQEIPAYETQHLAGGGKSQRPSTNNRLWPVPSRAPIQVCKRARASGGPRNCWLRERCSPRDAFQVLPSEIGGGVSV